VGFPLVADRSATHKVPDVGVKLSKLVLDLQEGAGVGNRGGNLQAVANDSRVGQKLAHFFGVESRYLPRIKLAEDLAVALAFSQDGVPTQAGLRAFESQEFEPEVVVVDRNAPLFVVVGNVQRIACPVATYRFGLPFRHWASASG